MLSNLENAGVMTSLQSVISRVQVVPRSSGICNIRIQQVLSINFYNHNDDFIEHVCVFLHKLMDKRMKVEHMHMGNSGKSKKVMENSDPKLNSKWEFIAYNTPQQNELVGVELAFIDGHAMTMCNTTKMSVMT